MTGVTLCRSARAVSQLPWGVFGFFQCQGPALAGAGLGQRPVGKAPVGCPWAACRHNPETFLSGWLA